MQVNSVSTNSFGSSKSQQALTRATLEMFADLDDQVLKQKSREAAAIQLNQKKHNKINNMIYWSIPLAGGLASVATNSAKVTSKLSPLLKNAAIFGKSALGWAGAFLAIDLLIAGKNKLTQKSETLQKFDREHPILSTVIGVGATLATLVLGAKGLKKLAPMAKKLVKPEFAEKISKAANNFITKLNDKVTGSKVIDKLTKGISAMPSALKKVLKGAAEWGPLALVFASIAHTSRFANAKRAQTEKNYQELKIAQAEARELLKMPELPEVDIF